MCDVAKVRALNDEFRTSLKGGKVIATRGVIYRPDLSILVKKVREFDEFTEDNDPYGEHDFGAFTHSGERFYFKIDYYSSDMKMGSADPADPAKTTRVLTILRAEEY